MTADGRTSISDGFEVARQLLLAPRESLDGRDAAKIVLFLSDGEQTVDAAPGMTEFETALAAAATVKSLPATVFAWGYGDQLKLTTLEGPGGLKAFAKQLVSQYALGMDVVRFSVVSFAADATTRVAWSTNDIEINAGIDEMSADGKTSISDGFEAARQLFANHGRVGATKVVLLVSDDEQTVDAAPGKTMLETAVDAAALIKEMGVTVFAWGFGNKVSSAMLEWVATDPSKAILAQDLAELASYLVLLEVAVCNDSSTSAAAVTADPNDLLAVTAVAAVATVSAAEHE
eukprot:scaffold104241_cov78-Phaeocystis_antarctica.AAC.1